MKNGLAKITFTLPLLDSPAALACPICFSDRATAVRGGIFYDGNFFANLLIALSPFAVLAPVVYWAYFHFPMPQEKRDENLNPALFKRGKQNAF